MNNEMITALSEITWLNGMNHGWGNGYVLIPTTSKLHGLDYNDEKLNDISIHGGLTYAELATKDDLNNFNVSLDFIGYWVLGFDTAHYDDNQTNWTKERVQEEANNLLMQLVALE